MDIFHCTWWLITIKSLYALYKFNDKEDMCVHHYPYIKITLLHVRCDIFLSITAVLVVNA